MIRSAPARLIDVRISIITRGPSIQPRSRGRLHHRVLAADVVRRDRQRERVARLADDVEIRQRRLDHHDVGAFLDVERDLAHRLATVRRIHLIRAPVAELRRRLRGLAERAVEPRRELRGVRHDRRRPACRARRARRRIAPTRPSIMSDGATKSAPAAAKETACFISSGSV